MVCVACMSMYNISKRSHYQSSMKRLVTILTLSLFRNVHIWPFSDVSSCSDVWEVADLLPENLSEEIFSSHETKSKTSSFLELSERADRRSEVNFQICFLSRNYFAQDFLLHISCSNSFWIICACQIFFFFFLK